jgi:uncharacterized phage infection (PIP) family protein YhgE
MLKRFKNTEDKVRSLASNMLDNRFKEMKFELSHQERVTTLSLIINILLFLISFGMAGILSSFIARAFEKETKKLENFTEKIKNRNLMSLLDVPNNSKNEIHLIGQKINQIIKNLRELLSEVRDGISHISSGAEEFSAMITQNVEHSKQAFENVKDLLMYIEEFKKKINDLNQALSQLTMAVNEIAKNATETSAESDHAYMEMENLNVIFALAQMANRIYLVARSRVSEVNAAEIAVEFNGGGHPQAASATISDKTLIQVEEKLQRYLSNKVNFERLAKDIMTSPVIHILSYSLISEAKRLLTNYNINVLMVIDSQKCIES